MKLRHTKFADQCLSLFLAKLWHPLHSRLQLHHSGYLGRFAWVSLPHSKLKYRDILVAN